MATPVTDLDEVHASLLRQYKAGEIGQNTYFGGVVGIAAQFAERGYMEDAVSMAGKLPIAYIDNVLPQQIELSSELWSEMVYRLAVRLSNAGLAIPPGEEITTAVSVRVTTSAQN